MSQTIVCPSCARRLQLPDDFQAELVRCPNCETTFPAESARSVPSPVVTALPPAPPRQPALPPAAEDACRGEKTWAEKGRPRRGDIRRTARNPCLIVALALGGLFLMLGIVLAVMVAVLWRMQGPPTNFSARIEEDEEDRRELLRQAFKDQKPLAEDEIVRQVKPLFDDLAVALRSQNAERIMTLFDMDRMMDEFAAAGGGLPMRTPRERREFRRGLRQGTGQGLAQRGQIFHWDATEIRKITKLNNDEVMIIARHKHPNGVTLKMRWWVTRRNGDWKVYDFEDLDMGARVSSEIASLLGQGLGRVLEVGPAIKAVGEAMQAVVMDDVDGAERKLNQVRGTKLPQRFESTRQLVWGMILFRREKYPESLVALEEAHRLQADLPLTDYLRGVVLNKLGKPDKALVLLRGYRDLLGEDAEVCREIAEALREQHNFSEASKEYRKSLDFNPKGEEAFLGLLRSLGGNDNMEDVGPRFAKLDNLRENFDACAEDCENREFPQLLEPLVKAMRKLDPDYPPVDFYDSVVQARTGHPDEAVRALKAGLGKEKDEPRRQHFEWGFLKAMAAGGHYSKAYAAVSDARKAFPFLAAEAVKRYRTEELKRLVAEHAKKHAADPLLGLYRAEVHVQQGQYDRADRAFTEALTHHPDAEALQTFRASRVLARYHTGQVMSAYRDIGPREETFAQLASLLYYDDKDAQLQSLLDTHAKQFPDSWEAARFRARLLIRQNKLDQGVAAFRSALAKTKAKDKRSQLVSEFLGDMLAAGKPVEGYRARPDAGEAFRELASRMLDDDVWDDLRPLLEAHRAGHAEDPWLAYYQSEVYQHDEAWDKAAKVLAEARKRGAKEVEENIRTNYVFVLYKLGQWQRAYDEVRPRNATFTQLANLMANDKKGAELQALIRAHKPHAKDDPAVLNYEARARVLAKQWADAVALFRQAYQKQTDPYQRMAYQSSFLTDMAEAGQWREGYRAAADKETALNTLAGHFLFLKKDKELAALLEEHHKAGGSGPWESFYRGELHLLHGEAREAVRDFAAAAAKAGPENPWRFRDGLNRARVRAGEAVAAYEEGKTNDGTFTSLAHLCNQNKDARQLQALLDAHRKVKPDDPNLVSWQLELLWLKQDYEGALRLLKEHHDDVFVQSQFRWKADEFRVRCLAKLKRGDEAIRAAEEVVKRRSGDRLLLVLAQAATGDVQRTIAALGDPKRSAFLVRRCYQDADLGPLLRSKEFAAFRDKFPEPKEDKGTEGR